VTSGSKTGISTSVFLNIPFQNQEYTPKYCTLAEFQDFYQADVTENSVPNADTVLRLLQGAEAEVDTKEWGKYTQVDEFMDGRYEILTFNWQYVGFFCQIIYPAHPNIIRIIKCHTNMGGPVSSEPIWQEVKEGPADNSNFIMLRKSRQKSQVGSALLFYTNVPYPGPLRFRLTYEYGMDVDRSLLREYVGKKVAMDSLEMRTAAENINLNFDKGPWAALYRGYEKRLKQMREELFPKMNRKPYVFPSTL
jgi:hypothetical protein